MPEVVSQGRKPGVQECGVCHRAGGTGGPENLSLARLRRRYRRTTAEFQSSVMAFGR